MVKTARQVPGVNAAEGHAATSAHLIPSKGEPIAILFSALKNPETLTLNQLKPRLGEIFHTCIYR